MMKCVMCWRVNEFLKEVTCNHIAIVDENCPDVDDDEEGDVEVLVERHHEGENMVGH